MSILTTVVVDVKIFAMADVLADADKNVAAVVLVMLIKAINP